MTIRRKPANKTSLPSAFSSPLLGTGLCLSCSKKRADEANRTFLKMLLERQNENQSTEHPSKLALGTLTWSPNSGAQMEFSECLLTEEQMCLPARWLDIHTRGDGLPWLCSWQVGGEGGRKRVVHELTTGSQSDFVTEHTNLFGQHITAWCPQRAFRALGHPLWHQAVQDNQ